MRAVLWCTLAVAVAIGALTIVRWYDWNYGLDLGIFAQVVANVPHGFTDQTELGTHFRFHFAPILALLWPAMALGRSPLVLQAAQIVLISATTPVFYALARRHTDERTATWLALLVLFNPFLYSQAFNEFHELCFLPPLALGLVWALESGRLPLAALLALLTFGVREDAALVTACALAIFALVAWYRARRGLALFCAALAAIGLAVLGGYFAVAGRLLGGWEPAAFYQYPFATTPLGVVIALVAQPALAWPALLTLGRLGYLAEALACSAFALWSPWLVLALPGLAIVLLANSFGVWRIGAQYALLWLPWLFVAFGDGARRLEPLARRRGLIASSVFLGLLALVGNPLHLGSYLQPSYHDLADARRALAFVGNQPLSTHDEWQTQISVSDPGSSAVLSPSSRWFVYADDYPSATFQRDVKPRLDAWLHAGAIRVERRFGPVVVYERVGPAAVQPADDRPQ